MRILLETGLLFKRKMKETIRQPIWMFMGLTTPLLYMLLFSPLLKNLSNPPLSTGAVMEGFVPGILTLLAFLGASGAGYGVISELQTGVIERLRVSPASRFSLLMGGVLRDTITFLVPCILVLFIASILGFRAHPGGILVMFVLLCLLCAAVSAWSASLGLILKQTGSMAALIAGLELPLTLLSGVLLPLSLGPVWLRILAHINPLYYIVEASRVLCRGDIMAQEVFKAFGVMIPLTALILVWAVRVYRKAVA